MPPTKQQLEEEYQSLSNSRLESIVEAGTFSDTAVEVASNELRSRGVTLGKQTSDLTQGDGEGDGDENHVSSADPQTEVDLVTVYRSDNPFKANIVSNLLESEGVFAYVWGQNLGVAHTFLSFAAGGMRVQVREDQLAQATEIVARFERGDYRLEEDE
jgi:hypothetical protein